VAKHPTALLSFGSEWPDYPVLIGLGPAAAVMAMNDGLSVHVATQEQAALVLHEVGLSQDEIDDRMRVADGLATSR
jgi:hypothetical protein